MVQVEQAARSRPRREKSTKTMAENCRDDRVGVGYVCRRSERSSSAGPTGGVLGEVPGRGREAEVPRGGRMKDLRGPIN